MARWHGLLHVAIREGEHVHDSYMLYQHHGKQSFMQKVTCGSDACAGPDVCWGKADPYIKVEVDIGGGKRQLLGRTPVVNNAHSPKWNHELSSVVDVCDEKIFAEDRMTGRHGPQIVFSCMDSDGMTNDDDLMGLAKFPLAEIAASKQPLRVALTMRHPDCPEHKNKETKSKLKVQLSWLPIGGADHPEGSLAVPGAYFKRTHGNLVRLYHDAECPEGMFDRIPMQGGMEFVAESAWRDMTEAIENAKYFIYMCGWSINPQISLTRSYAEGGEKFITVGDLLKKKAEEGVKVVLMVWDDITSRDNALGLMKSGLMCTYDEYCREFFENSKVHVSLCKRTAGDDVGAIADMLKWTSFTHHQKCVIFDTKNPLDPPGRRVVGAFVGGLDVTSGRYDCGRHELFHSLNNAHADDFYNGCLPGVEVSSGPREPWHDIHSRVIGPAAWDVLQNYIERIACQEPKLSGVTSLYVNELKDRKKIRDGRCVLIDPADPRSWDVQVLRSIDSEAALFQQRKWLNRFSNPKLYVERSIQQAYTFVIDQAKRFIYIENQYFLGSAQYWLEYADTPCTHLVPYALVRRICKAIDMGEKFTVYVLIPLFPEGAPASGSVQEILFWQYQTMRMMYGRIGAKLKEAGNTVCHPRDYLAFFFVGNREPDATIPLPRSAGVEITEAAKHRRHQIYVHSKMIITDDEFILIGSANINERSMAGCRDTEIAVACHQSNFRCQSAGGQVVTPRGDIYGFRQQLWQEHLGRLHPEFDDPADLSCVRKVNTMADENWMAYAAEENQHMPHGHLCTYPLHVSQAGECLPIADHPHIPDFTCPVAGTKSGLLPTPLTT